jgi:tetratricopeptide (TPR) repeat protein
MPTGPSRSLLCLAFLAAWLPPPAALALQQRPADPAAPRGSNSPTSTPRRSQPDLDRRQQSPQLIFVSGTVVTDDGSPIPSGVVIERTCGSQVTKEAYLDVSGHFHFQIGGGPRSAAILPDASESGFDTNPADFNSGRRTPAFGSSGAAAVTLSGCELYASAAGYKSTRVILQGIHGSEQVDAGTIVLYSLSRVTGHLVSITEMSAPKTARKSYERAQQALKKGKRDEAETHLARTVEAYPAYAAAWLTIGRLRLQAGQNSEARAALDKAIAADAKYVAPYVAMARLDAAEQDWHGVLTMTGRALELDPVNFPDAYMLNALASFQLNELDAAEKSARRVERLDAQHRLPQVHLLLADIFESRKNIPGAIEQLRAFVTFAQPSSAVDKARLRLAALESAPGRVAEKQESR